VTAVGVEQTLQRVDEDWEAGRRTLARQRLRGLVASFPQRLDLRERLAELYRAEGDAAQAGRWAYLADDRSDLEAAAFEKAFGANPVRMMAALGWRGSEQAAGTAAEQRLRALRQRAERQVGSPVTWEPPHLTEEPTTWWDTAGMVAGCLLLLAVGVPVLVGVGALALHGLGIIRGWLP
jgi:hypothetical protein